jgi:heme-degrading monooxygenase HmoA
MLSTAERSRSRMAAILHRKQNYILNHREDEHMLAVIFEVEPNPERYDEYLTIAAQLRPELEKIDGFISVERFSSLYNEGKILSLSFWRDERAILAWREHPLHREMQRRGREAIFRDYRLRVANIVRDYGMFERDESPQSFPARERPPSL